MDAGDQHSNRPGPSSLRIVTTADPGWPGSFQKRKASGGGYRVGLAQRWTPDGGISTFRFVSSVALQRCFRAGKRDHFSTEIASTIVFTRWMIE